MHRIKQLFLNSGVNPAFVVFLIMVCAAAVGNGFSDSIYANYYKDVYDVTATQRAFIEFPRELPGLLCAFVIASFSFLGDFKLSLIAQILACTGLTVLGLFTPSFSLMLLFLFINSLGMHLFMPLQDSITMSMSDPDKVGRQMGKVASLKTGVAFLSGLIVFLGFRFGGFTFKSDVKPVFLIGAAAFLVAIGAALVLVRLGRGKTAAPKKKFHLIFRWRYRYFYLLTILSGVQKQIAYVYGSWVIIDLLLKGADIMSLLVIVSSFVGIFFISLIGRWMDRKGIKFMMYIDALSFIIVYVIYGFVVWAITQNFLPGEGWPVIIVYVLFVLDRMSMQVGIVRAVYLRSIAENKEEVTQVLSTGTSLDHVVAIIAAQLCGLIWTFWGPYWVFFLAAAFSLGNLFVAWRIKE